MTNINIYPVKESKARFTCKDVFLVQLDGKSNFQIEKTVINKSGFSKVTGLKTYEVKNDRFDESKVGTVNQFGFQYNETEFTTLTEWIFE